MFELLVVERVR